MLGGLLGILSPVTDAADSVVDTVLDVAEELSPGISEGQTLTGNLLNDNGVAGDLLQSTTEGDLIGGIAGGYDDVFAVGGAINNLADGHGLGVEGLLGTVLGTTDGVLGNLLGATDGILG